MLARALFPGTLYVQTRHWLIEEERPDKKYWSSRLRVGRGVSHSTLQLEYLELDIKFFFCSTGLMALDDLHKKVLKTSKSRQDVTEWVSVTNKMKL